MLVLDFLLPPLLLVTNEAVSAKSAASDGFQRDRETSIRAVTSRTKVGRHLAIQALKEHDNDIDNAVWHLQQRQEVAPDSLEDLRTQLRLDAASEYIQSKKRRKKGVTTPLERVKELTRTVPDPPKFRSSDTDLPTAY